MNTMQVFEGARLLTAKDSQEYDKLAKILTEAGYTPASRVCETGHADFHFMQEWHKIGIKLMEPPAVKPVAVLPGGLK